MKLIVTRSPQHGTGVFAGCRFAAGDEIIQFTGPVLPRSAVQPDSYHLQIGEETYLGASGEADDYVNHSCEPNAGIRQDLMLVAVRDIAIGEEITWDYSTAIDEEDFEGFPCQCGALHCRGRVQSFRALDSMTRERLKPWLMPYLLRKYYSRSCG